MSPASQCVKTFPKDDIINGPNIKYEHYSYFVIIPICAQGYSVSCLLLVSRRRLENADRLVQACAWPELSHSYSPWQNEAILDDSEESI